MTVPSWADAYLSGEICGLREKGEGQVLEFKQDLPEQLHELAKHIAAFGSSGGGKILIGVADEGSLVGLLYADPADRDAIWRRVQGVTTAVKPEIKTNLVFAVETDKTVLVLDVPKQEEPVFYYEGRPYIREGSVSRPATPNEVKELIWCHPSSEHKRFMEQDKRKWLTLLQDDSTRQIAQSEESLRALNRTLLRQ